MFVVSGVGLIVYFQTEKERMARKRIAELNKAVGKPKVGGPLTGLVDQHKKTRTDDEFLGKFRLVRWIAGGFAVRWSFSDSNAPRFTLASRIAPTFAPRSWTKWPE